MKIYVPHLPRITDDNVIIFFNYCIYILASSKTSISDLRNPILNIWGKQFEERTGKSFEEETNTTSKKLKRVGATKHIRKPSHWEMKNYHDFDKVFHALLKYMEKDNEGNWTLAGYELNDNIISVIKKRYKDAC